MFSSTIYDFFAANSIGKYLLEHEHQSYCIVVGYVLFVIWLGPSWMRTRKPFDLKIPMILYSFIMSALNFVLMIQVYQHLADTWDVRCSKDAPLYQQKMQDRMFIPWNAIFEKHFAFFDTIFFMLRKKQNQLTFLHVYHHTVTCLVVLWFAVTQDLTFFVLTNMLLNSFVHVIMYFYYGLSAFGKSMQKYLWWKRYLTIIQIVQFLLMLSWALITFGSGCEKITNLQSAYSIYIITILALFINFYRKSFKRMKTE
ncbi:elongation of very long chain fatty acids protein 4-like [Argiope bruennichi]|uniref:elongation of very long chain fatty acids protein 4-like n=1 Tax=Argiope bruennichi TaxID=94029 RepID=UPI0024948C53|nr:elongation of very long chain fatty acids protein 4-like [Argiope bruennichi]